MTITVRSEASRQIIDITDQVAELCEGDGLVHVFLQHTSAALLLADFDPGTDRDYMQAVRSMTPQEAWNHPHDPKHFPDHLWSSLIGQDITVPICDGTLQLGSWQRIVLFELNGPRERTCVITRLTR